MATAPKISNLPAAPNRQQPANFSAKGDALLSSMQGFATQANALADFVEAAAEQVASDKDIGAEAKALSLEVLGLEPTLKSYQDNAKAYRDTTAQTALLVEGYRADVASAFVYQNLASVALSKGITMVGGFIDTSPRPSLAVQKSQSWFDTLGPMPTRMVGILHAKRLHVYDGDDPSYPEWFQVDGGSLYDALTVWDGVPQNHLSISCAGGRIYVASDVYGVGEIDFGKGTITRWRGIASQEYQGLYLGGIEEANDGKKWTGPSDNHPLLVGANAYCVDSRVYDWSPVDPVSGLQIPTAAVGRDNGVSIINGPAGAGTIVHITMSGTFSVRQVRLDADGSITFTADTSFDRQHIHMVFELPSEDLNLGTNYYTGGGDAFFNSSFVDRGGESRKILLGKYNNLADGLIGNENGLTFQKINQQDPTRTLQAYVTADHNTGWMGKSCVAALLSSTDTSSLVGGEMVPSGKFDDPTDLDDWTALFSTDLSVVNGVMRVTTTDGTSAAANLEVPVVVGNAYRLTIGVAGVAGGSVLVRFGPSQNNGAYFTTANADIQTHEATFVAQTDTLHIRLYSSTGAKNAGNYVDYDSISVVPLEPDRSGNGNHGVIAGTSPIPREPMTTGGESVGYKFGGHDGHIYINSDDFSVGLGDFCMSVVFQGTQGTGGSRNLLVLHDGSDESKNVKLLVRSNAPRVQVNDTWTLAGGPQINDGRPWHLVVLRRSGQLELWCQGVLIEAIDRATLDINYANPRVQISETGMLNLDLLTDFKFHTEAPTPTEIREMCRAALAATRGAITLTGTSSDVKAVAHDEATGLHHGGTPSGRSDFAFPNRVNETATPVTTKIIAHDGTVMEQ